MRNTLFIAAALALVGFAGTGLFADGSTGAVYGLYGVCGGAGVGIGYNSVIATTNVWLPDRVGVSSSIMTKGFGLGSLIPGTASVNIAGAVGINVVSVGVGVTAVIAFILSLVLKRPPPGNIVKLLAPEGVTDGGADPGEQDAALKTGVFYLYWVWAAIVIGIGLTAIGNCASDAQHGQLVVSNKM